MIFINFIEPNLEVLLAWFGKLQDDTKTDFGKNDRLTHDPTHHRKLSKRIILRSLMFFER